MDMKELKPDEAMTGEYLGYVWIVARMSMGHLCGYVKLWKKHPLEILWKTEMYPYDKINIDCHGGLTFGKKLTKKNILPKSSFTPGYWIGWDYAHCGDEMIINELNYKSTLPGKRWTEIEVINECRDVIKQLVEKYPKAKII